MTKTFKNTMLNTTQAKLLIHTERDLELVSIYLNDNEIKYEPMQVAKSQAVILSMGNFNYPIEINFNKTLLEPEGYNKFDLILKTAS